MTVRVEQFAIILVLILRVLSEKCHGPELKDNIMKTCIAQCLNLESKKICSVNYTTGGFAEENCEINRPFQKTLEVSDQKIVVCEVHPNNDAYLKGKKISDYNMCTHFHFGSWHLYNPVDKTFEPRTDNIPKQWPVKEYAQQRGAKTILSFGHSNSEFGLSPGNWSILAADAVTRAKLIEQMILKTEELEFDAISIYWWYSSCPDNNCAKGNSKDKENLVSLMRELYKAIKARGKSLFLILPASKAVLNKGYDLHELWDYVDYFYVLTYLYDGIWNNYLGYTANIYNIKVSIVAIREILGIERMHKVIGGITSTVAQYTLIIPNAKPKFKDITFGAASQSSNTGIFKVCEKIQFEKYKVILDDVNNNFAHDTMRVYVFEDLNTLREKINYFKSNRMGGIFYAPLHADDSEQICGCGAFPILRAASELLHGAGCIVKHHSKFSISLRAYFWGQISGVRGGEKIATFGPKLLCLHFIHSALILGAHPTGCDEHRL